MRANITSHNLLNLFDSLPEKEKAEVAAAIIKKTSMPELPDSSDNDFTLTAEIKNNVRQETIWDKIDKHIRNVPSELWENIPADGSEQHDHYLYGTPEK